MGSARLSGPELALRAARLLGASWRGKARGTREFNGQGGKRRRGTGETTHLLPLDWSGLNSKR